MSNPTKSLIICLHAHQPIGNFDWVFEEAYQKSYKPFFEVLQKHPKILVSAHFSGCLIDWLEKHKPDFIQLLRQISDRGQLEFVGGAYYEPIYGLIPEKDLKGQVVMMKDKLHALFNHTPEGVWLTERVWDSKVIKPLSESGVRFSILDDLHFEKVGVQAPLTGYYAAKSGKYSLDLFASMKNLRYLMPFRKAEETIQFIEQTNTPSQDVFVFADDIEKFGMWPGTYDWVYKEGWLDQFFTLLEENKNITLYSFKNFRQAFKPKGLVTIPHASYMEMMEWSGGYFYNFFKKYAESNFMRERMWAVSEKLKKLSSKNGNSRYLEEARRALYKAQCNCSYWHGVFGGLYLHHLRSAVFENLIAAEKALLKVGKVSKKKSRISLEKMESGDLVRTEQKDLAAHINPAYGASVQELDYLPKNVNLMCNLRRQKEVYHEAVLNKKPQSASSEHASIHEMLGVKEEGLEKHLHYDLYGKYSFLDHFFEDEINREMFGSIAYKEAGDFTDKRYKLQLKKGSQEKAIFTRTSYLKLQERRYPFQIQKTFTPKGGQSLLMQILLSNQSSNSASFVWGVEFNFSIGDEEARKGLDQKDVQNWVFRDSWRSIGIELNSKSKFRLITTPIETVSESESGLERTYQELGVLLQRSISLKPKESVQYEIELAVKSL